MFDIGFWELAVIATIMLVVLGPERLPGVARAAGFWLSKVRRMVSDVKAEVKKEMDAAELKELQDAKDQIQQAGRKVREELNKDIVNQETDVNNTTENKKPENSEAKTEAKDESA